MQYEQLLITRCFAPRCGNYSVDIIAEASDILQSIRVA